MKIGKTLFAVLLTVFCLSIMVFSAVPTGSTAGGYDPQLDINHDGVINMKDIGSVARSFSPTNTGNDPTVPANVTNWEVDGYHKYSVDLIVDTANASVGNTEPVRIFVHVTYQGQPVVTASSDNYHANSGISGPLGTWPDGPLLYYWNDTTYPGVYEFRSTPLPPAVWLVGKYVFIIGCYVPAPPESAVYTGEAMGSFTIPP
jgi:hypothetical protein